MNHAVKTHGSHEAWFHSSTQRGVTSYPPGRTYHQGDGRRLGWLHNHSERVAEEESLNPSFTASSLTGLSWSVGINLFFGLTSSCSQLLRCEVFVNCTQSVVIERKKENTKLLSGTTNP
jgi:hypothetical protein